MNALPAPAPAPTGAAALPSEAAVAVIILTFNEERHIARAIHSVRAFASDILVVDSFSTDRTVEIAEAQGARVLCHPFVNQAKQFQWALDEGGVTAPWILRLDADEIIEPDLAAAITNTLPTLPADVVGINLNRKHIFMGRWVRHGDRYPLLMMRLWRNGHGRVEDRWMDEHVVTWGGRTITLDGGFADASLHDLTFFTDKHNKYATREAVDVLSRRHGLGAAEEDAALAQGQASWKRRLKTGLFYRLPAFAGPLGYFLYRYIVRLGFLDGREGLVYHFLQGFWYRFLVEAKVIELERGLAECTGAEAKRRRLAELTGLKL